MPLAPMSPFATVRGRVVVALSAALVLIVGYLMKPETARTQPDDVPGPMLEEVVGRREALSIFTRLQQAGERSIVYAARISTPAAPREDDLPLAPTSSERYGVLVASNRIRTVGDELAAGATVRVTFGDGRTFDGVVDAFAGPYGTLDVLVNADPPLMPPPIDRDVRPGEPLLASAPGAHGPVLAPLFSAAVLDDTIVVTQRLDPFRGMPVFRESGGLTGIVAGPPGAAVLVRLPPAAGPQ